MSPRLRKAGRVAVWFATVMAILTGIAFVVDIERDTLDAVERDRLGGTYVHLSQGVTHYRLQGPAYGPTVVLVHGGTIPIWTWDYLMPVLTATGYRVLAYDAFGRGYSDRPAVVYDRQLYLSQLRELVDSLRIGVPFDIVGLSLGGGTAVTFTATYPERVRKLVLIAPVVRDLVVPRLFQVPVIGDLSARAFGMRVLARRSRSLFAGSPDQDRYITLMDEQVRYKGFRNSALSMLRNDALGDFTAEYRTVGRQTRPVLLLWGTADVEITRAMIDTARAAIPNVVFRSFGAVGHGIVFQRPDSINHQVLDFLGSPNSPSR